MATDVGPARLAELVAALSLGIDLGFGQPMEHVLRQCMIALRLAERISLDDDSRSAVYYTALLVNVGCHSDAHEQAKWFGDDIALKSHKYDYAPRSILGAAASVRLVGRGHPPAHRFRVGLEFLLGGYRDLDGMIARHAELARSLAGELGLPGAVQEAVGASYEQWDGRGWPGHVRGDAVPIAARLATLAEYAEVAHRMGGVDAVRLLARKRGGAQFDPALTGLLSRHAEEIFAGLDSARTWDEVITAEPSLGVTLSPDRLDLALLGVANFVDLKSPYTLGHAPAVAGLAAAAGANLGWPRRTPRCRAARAWSRAWASWEYRTRSGTSPVRWARASGSACACTPT
jgi:HD domain